MNRKYFFVLFLISLNVIFLLYFFTQFLNNTLTVENVLYPIGIQLLVIILILILQKYWETFSRYAKQDYLLTSVREVLEGIGEIRSVYEFEQKIMMKILAILNLRGMALEIYSQPEPIRIVVGELDRTVANYDIRQQNQQVCSLLIGGKQNGFDFTDEEIKSIELIIHYLSIAIENLELIKRLGGELEQYMNQLDEDISGRDLTWLRRSMFQIQEKDRQRIAADLHDTALQDVYFLLQKIRTDLQTIEVNQNRELKLRLEDYQERLEFINLELRQTCFEVYPHLLDGDGFLPALKQYIESEGCKTDIFIQLEMNVINHSQFEMIPTETKRHLYRIIQELWNNTKKHAQAKHVSIQITELTDAYQIVYKDDGIGMEIDHAFNMKSGLDNKSVGLRQIRNRILEIGAVCEVVSATNQGMSFMIRLPFDRNIVTIQKGAVN
jgi:two-component system sensor histidine kinase ComP